MTSVSIISAVAARIKYLMNESKQPTSLSDDAKGLLLGLEEIRVSLIAADQETKRGAEFVKLEKQIVHLCYEFDDAIAAMELRSPPKTRGKLLGVLARTSPGSSNADPKSLLNDLQDIKKKLAPVLRNQKGKKNENSSALTSHHYQANINLGITRAASRGEDLPRMEDEVKAALLREDLPGVCLWGKSGMGKTTIAWKAFYHDEVRQHFKVFAWVPINQDFQTKKVLQDILLQLLPDEKEDIRLMDEIQLSQHIFSVLKKKRCLVVLKGIRTLQDWESIGVALLIGKSSSQILITTPSKELAEAAAIYRYGVWEMKPLNEAEWFMILQKKGRFDKPAELQTVGKKIFSLSQGSPLMAAILGKFLKTLDAAARGQLVDELDYYISQISEGETKVLGLCYDRLADELKSCLLYMGQFPEDQDIEVEKLYLLLAAEDIIPPEDSGRSKTIFMESILEKLALKGLIEVQEDKKLALKGLIEVQEDEKLAPQELVQLQEDKKLTLKGLIEVQEDNKLAPQELVQLQEDKVSMSRSYKFCRFHEQIRNFCITKGLHEEFFEIVEFESGKEVQDSTRRLAIYLCKYKDGDAIPFSSQDTVKKIRSLLIFDTHEAQQEATWPSGINDLKEFSYLRVLDFDGVDFRVRNFPRGIDRLVFLRYLSIRRCYLRAFPFSVSTFPYLETLDLRVHTDGMMTIPNIFSSMKRLRHLYFPVLYASDGNDKLQLKDLEKLEILVNFDTQECGVKDLSHLKNLQILVTISEGDHEVLEAILKYLNTAGACLQESSLIIRNFDCYTIGRVTIFRELLECKSLQSLNIEGQIGQLLKDVTISPNFTELIFDGSELEYDSMHVLGKLENLRCLVLSNNAFVGNEIFFNYALEFPNLRSLKLLNLPYLEKLTFGEEAMPKLSTLVIDMCDYLKEVFISEALHERLQDAQRKKGDDVYSVQPLITIVHDRLIRLEGHRFSARR